MTGTDTWLAEPTVGVPTCGRTAGPAWSHITIRRTGRRRSIPKSLHDLVAINASFLYYVANAGEPEARWLAGLALDRAYEQVLAARRKGLDQINYSVDRGSDAVRSVLRLVPKDRQAALSSDLQPLLDSLRRFGNDQAARVEAPAHTRRRIHRLAEAARMIVKRKGIGTIPLDELSPDRREGFPSGAWASTPIIALYWCDGQRNLADVIRLTRLELGPGKFDFVGYFRFLERHGYVEIH